MFYKVFCLFVNKPINNVALEISVNMAIFVSAVPVSVEIKVSMYSCLSIKSWAGDR